MNVEFEPLIERGERLARLFRKGYTRWTKDATVVPPPNSSTPLDDTTKPCDDSSKINSEGRRYIIRDHKEPDKLGFSKSSSNVVYPVSDFVSYLR
ncbi:hypothetical protein ACOSP7_026755 [Xanthoceras sorbifolium]